MPQRRKKTPKNAFYFFMKHVKDKLLNEGTPIQGGVDKVSEIATPLWKNMSVDEKSIYESMAVEYKVWEEVNLENKHAGTNASVAENQTENTRTSQMKMYSDIREEVSHCFRKRTLSENVFYFIHCNYYCRTEEGKYFPCEVALVEFSLENGIQREYQNFVSPQKLPIGYTFEARKWSEETHQIEIPPNDTSEKNYAKVLGQIKDFIRDKHLGMRGKLVPLYTSRSNLECVESVITQFCDFSGDDPDSFRFYTVHRLLFELKNTAAAGYGDANKGFPAETVAESEIQSDIYQFTKGIACSFHEETDAFQFCSLSIVKRWCFMIADHCCELMNIEMIPGSHCTRTPDRAKLNRKEKATTNEKYDSARTPDRTKLNWMNNVVHEDNDCERTGNKVKLNQDKSVIEDEEDSEWKIVTTKKGSRNKNEKMTTAGCAQRNHIRIINRSPAKLSDDDDDEYVPLRRPKTKGHAQAAFFASEESKAGRQFSADDDFPGLSAAHFNRSFGRGSLFNNVPEIPVAVAGRGTATESNNSTVTAERPGRGRGLAIHFDKLQIQ